VTETAYMRQFYNN